MIKITIYSKPGCHLCDDMKAVVTRVAGRTATIDEVDITSDPELQRLYALEIPVLVINGRKIAKYRIDEPTLKRALEAGR